MRRCCCESSPPEFGGNLPDRECPIHGEAGDVFEPSDEDMRAYLDGEHGAPHPEVVAIIQDDLERNVRTPGATA